VGELQKLKIGGGGTTKAQYKRWGNSVPPSSPLLWPLVVASGPYANHVHFAPDTEPHQQPNTQFLWAGCTSCCPTNSIKAL